MYIILMSLAKFNVFSIAYVICHVQVFFRLRTDIQDFLTWCYQGMLGIICLQLQTRYNFFLI
jgi:hypothetical protein